MRLFPPRRFWVVAGEDNDTQLTVRQHRFAWCVPGADQVVDGPFDDREAAAEALEFWESKLKTMPRLAADPTE